MAQITLKTGRILSDYGEPYIVAEVNSSHNGNVEVARQMIDAAAEAGCNCVKFQSWSAESLYSTSYYKENPISKRIVTKFSLRVLITAQPHIPTKRSISFWTSVEHHL